MAAINFNCIVCAEECEVHKSHNLVFSKLNSTKFKICQSCLNLSDPSDNYLEIRKILGSYVRVNEAKKMFKEIKLALAKKNI